MRKLQFDPESLMVTSFGIAEPIDATDTVRQPGQGCICFAPPCICSAGPDCTQASA